MVGVVAQLGEHRHFFRLRWERLGGPPPYICMYVGMYRRGVSAAERFKRETSAYLFRLLCKAGFSVESKYRQLGLTLKIGMRKYYVCRVRILVQYKFG